MLLSHRRKLKSQEIVLEALKTGHEIPYNFLQQKQQTSNLRIGIILIITGIGILITSLFSGLSTSLSFVPISTGLGFIVAAYTIQD